jgi:transcriptional regulator with XRE-family HTH domain
MGYHYGLTIKKYRRLRDWTQAELAAKWPKTDGSEGVNKTYVQDIEAGRKHIADQETLRQIAALLAIPLYELGLSEYNPFNEDDMVYPFIDIGTLHALIEDMWYIRLNMPSEITEKKIISLSYKFSHLINSNPKLLNNRDFLVLYAQVKRLQEVIFTERYNYAKSLQCAQSMLSIARRSGDSASESIALTRIGVELLRDENIEALEYLEHARDISFNTSSKEVGAYCYTHLARGYAIFGDKKRFVQAIDTAVTLADGMKGLPVVTKDYIFHAYSAILEERSNGFILSGNGKEAVKYLPEIEVQIANEGNTYLKMWIPLDYAQSYMLMGEIEESVKHLEAFYVGIKNFKSARIHSKVGRHIDQLDSLGYADISAVKNFKNMYYEAKNSPMRG